MILIIAIPAIIATITHTKSPIIETTTLMKPPISPTITIATKTSAIGISNINPRNCANLPIIITPFIIGAVIFAKTKREAHVELPFELFTP